MSYSWTIENNNPKMNISIQNRNTAIKSSLSDYVKQFFKLIIHITCVFKSWSHIKNCTTKNNTKLFSIHHNNHLKAPTKRLNFFSSSLNLFILHKVIGHSITFTFYTQRIVVVNKVKVTHFYSNKINSFGS